jgi:multidrug efflux pump subunit AcrA (membrane-fusion protein)
MDFVDNQFDPDSGTSIGRAIVPNSDLLLSPGLFVRLRIPGSGRHSAILVHDEAIGTDLNQKLVWVIDAEGSVREYLVLPLTVPGSASCAGIGPEGASSSRASRRCTRARGGAGRAHDRRPAAPSPAHEAVMKLEVT